jgi:hypothetical protein
VLDLMSNVGAKGASALGLGVKGLTALKTLGAAGAVNPGWISQRLPTALEFGDPLNPANAPNLRINYDAMRLDPEFLERAAQKVRDLVPNLTAEEKAGSAEGVMRALYQHMGENTLFFHDQQDPELLSIIADWSPGANKISRRDIAAAYNLPPTSSAGMIDALSPQNPWTTMSSWRGGPRT